VTKFYTKQSETNGGFMFKFFTIISFLSVSAAQASGVEKFLVDSDNAVQAGITATCTVPENTFPHIIGLQDLDTYVASNNPDFSSGYSAQSPLWFGDGAPLSLVSTAAVTSNEKVAQACAAQEAGTATPDQIAMIEEAVKTDQLWWEVKAEYDQDFDAKMTTVTGFVTARHIDFTSYRNWLDVFGPKLGNTSTNHTAANRIIEITGADTANARMIGDVIPYDVVDYCHNGHSFSSLTQDAEDGSIEEPVNAGIWKGCNEESGTPLIFQTTANCEDRLIWGEPVTAFDVAFSGGATAQMGDFVRLCPNTSKQIVKEACDAGDDDMCDALRNDTLSSICQADEQTQFSCKIEGRNAYISICEKNGNRSYVFGKNTGSPELRISQLIPEAEFAGPLYPSQFTFPNDKYFYRVTMGLGRSKVEVFSGEIGSEHLISTQKCEAW
jgi:hypothetical protein